MRNSILLVVLLFLFSVNGAHPDADHVDYGIIIDAGSSGSRIYLYQWPHRDDPSLPLVISTTINQVVVSKKINVPLASFASNPSNAGESLADLITYIKDNLDASRYADTPIYLKATAGMRAISEADQATIIADVRSYLHTTPFVFKDTYAQVIPGTDEGIYGWITVNYLLKILQQSSPVPYGALDMGGASTQITFVPEAKPSQYSSSIVLSSHSYDLYTYSYPLGLDQANRVILAGLLSDGSVDESGNILSPCYLKGYNETYAQTSKLVFGTSNFTACEAAVLKYLVKPNATCTSCGMDNIYQPKVAGKFYGFSGFAYTYAFYGLSNTATINDLFNVGRAYCGIDFSQALIDHPKESPAYAKNYCFTATYFYHLLIQYGFPVDTSSVVVQADVNGTEVTWALGGMIYEANLIPIETQSSETPEGAASSIVASSILLFIVLFSLLLQ